MLVTKSYNFIESSEVQSIAASLAQHGTFANAYGRNSGPTAHTTPIYPAALSLLYRIFGTGISGEIAQETFTCLIAALIWALMPVVSLACGMEPTIGIWAGFAGALLPINRWAETKGAFETSPGALFFVLLFAFYMRCWQSKNFSFASAVTAGILSGLAILVYAPLMSVASAVLITGYLLFRRKCRRDYVIFAITTFSMLIITLLPWGVRNYFALGGLVLTRSNFPLELSLSNNDLAEANFSGNERVMKRYHPRDSRIEKTRLHTLGELEYERQKRREAFQWIASHPRKFARLTVLRFFYFWFPKMKRALQTVLLIPITGLGLWGLISLLRKKHLAGYGFLIVLVTFPLVYYVVQSFARYVYPVEWVLFYLGAYQVSLVWKRQSQPERSTDATDCNYHALEVLPTTFTGQR